VRVTIYYQLPTHRLTGIYHILQSILTDLYLYHHILYISDIDTLYIQHIENGEEQKDT
jgi:hypothetical protein